MMDNWCRAAVVALAGFVACVSGLTPGWAAAAEIVRIGDSAGGVSADGSVVAGSFGNTEAMQLRAYRWDGTLGTAAMQDLGVLPGTEGSFGTEVSADGMVVVGQSGDFAFRWTAAGGNVAVGNGVAWNVSGDGSVVVGQSSEGSGFRGFRWTAGTGKTTLGDLAGGFDYSDARSVSADGSVVVGSSDGSAGSLAVRWVGSSTTPDVLGLLRSTHTFSEALDVSADGRVIVGVSGNGLENEAFRWTEAGGFEGIGDLPGGLLDSVAGGVSADGSVIVGVGNPGLDLPDEPFYWSETGGMRRLWDVLVEGGADMSAWESLIIATDVSADGRVVVGSGMTTAGEFAGFRAVVPEPGGMGVIIMAGVGMLRRRERRAAK